MQQIARPLKDFNSNQILQIVNWGNEKLNLSSKTLERETTKIITERVIDKDYLVGVNVNGQVLRP